jgi:4-hydroxy-2-oxoglutarate aldolase
VSDRLNLDGIFAPIPTSFDRHGLVQPEALTENVRRWAASPLHGLLALGSNGEAALLDDDESDAVIETVRASWPSDRVLLAGVGRESTRATIRAAEGAAARGADGVLVRTPAAFRRQMTPEALVAHFSAVADACPVPVLLYNLPGVSAYSLTLPAVAELAAHPNIAGMKETSSDLERLGEFAAARPAEFVVLTGWAPVLHPALLSGAVGGILAVANVLPEACVTLREHARAGRHADAAVLQRALTPLAQLVSSGHGVAGLKFALDELGYRGGPVRAPLLDASPEARSAIRSALEAWGATTR